MRPSIIVSGATGNDIRRMHLELVFYPHMITYDIGPFLPKDSPETPPESTATILLSAVHELLIMSVCHWVLGYESAFFFIRYKAKDRIMHCAVLLVLKKENAEQWAYVLS